MTEIPSQFREEAKELAAAAHGAARDDKDQRADILTARLLDMVVGLQRDVMENMRKEAVTVQELKQELKEGMARVEKRIEEFVSAFPAGDAVQHRLAHEAQMEAEQERKLFWNKMKFTFWALVLTAATSWLLFIAWKAFLLGPK